MWHQSPIAFLQGSRATGATANGNGTPADTTGLTTVQLIEVRESAAGTCTLSLEGSFDGTNWYALGYQQVDATTSLARATADLSILASSAHVYQVLDLYPQVRARISSVAGGATLRVKLYAVCV